MPLPDQLNTPLQIDRAGDVSKGMVDLVATHLVPPGAAAFLQNVEILQTGQIRRRKGVLSRGTPGGSLEPSGLGAFSDLRNGLHWLFALYGSEIYRSDGDQVWTRTASGASIYAAEAFFSQGRGATFTSTLYLSSGPYSANSSLPNSELVAIHYDAASGSFQFTQIPDVRPRAHLWYQNRLWVANSSHTLHGPDFLVWSDLLDGRAWTNGEAVQIDPEGGDPCTALLGVRGQTPQLLIFKERSVHLLEIAWQTDGFYPTTANALDFTTARLRPVTFNAGCIASRAAIWVPGLSGGRDVLFLARDGIRSLNRSQTDAQGGAPPPLSLPIQNFIDRITWKHAHRSAAGFWDNTAYFAVPIDGAETPNAVIAYNVFRDAWHTYNWDPRGFADSPIDGARKFFWISSTLRTDGMSSVTYGAHVYEAFTGSDDPGKQPIDTDLQLRAISFPETQSPESGLTRKKIWREARMRFQSGSTLASISIQYRLDDSSWRDLTTVVVSPDDAYPFLPVQLPFVFAEGTITQKNVGLTNLAPGRKLQLRIRDSSSKTTWKLLDIELRATPLNDPLNVNL